MTLPRLRALQTAWATQPPAARALALIAQALGWKPTSVVARRGAAAPPMPSREEIATMFGGVPGVTVKA